MESDHVTMTLQWTLGCMWFLTRDRIIENRFCKMLFHFTRTKTANVFSVFHFSASVLPKSLHSSSIRALPAMHFSCLHYWFLGFYDNHLHNGMQTCHIHQRHNLSPVSIHPHRILSNMFVHIYPLGHEPNTMCSTLDTSIHIHVEVPNKRVRWNKQCHNSNRLVFD